MAAPTGSGVSAPGLDQGSTATSLTIEAQPPGDPWTLTLTDRALPYRGLRLAGKMKVETTYYPGNPVGTQQVIGSEEGTSTITGQWKDRFIAQGNTSAGIVPAFLVGGINTSGSQVPTVYDLVYEVDQFRRLGRQVKVAWGSVIRVGIITDFEVNWLRQTDVEWSITFAWASQGEDAGAVASPAIIRLGTFLAEAATDLQNGAGDVANHAREVGVINSLLANNAAINLLQQKTQDIAALLALAQAGIAAAGDFVTEINNAIQSAYAAVDAVAKLVDQSVDVLFGAADAARKAAAIFTYVKGLYQDVENGIDARMSVYFYNVQHPGPTTGGLPAAPISSIDAGEMLYAEAAARRLRRVARDARHAMARWQAVAEASASPSTMLSVFIARQDDDLRRIAMLHYGSPNSWVDLASYNGLATSQLTAGRLIFVPHPLPPASVFGVPKQPIGTAMVGN